MPNNQEPTQPPSDGTTSSEEPLYQLVPTKGLRGIIGRRMLESASQKPHVTLVAPAEVDALDAHLRRSAAEIMAKTGERLTMTGLLVKLVGSALRSYPRINGRVEEGEIRLYRPVNVGVAVALDEGLVVPVIRDADSKPLPTIAAELADLSQRARARKLKIPDMMDGTFTITNLGSFGITQFTPIINPPEMAILGVGRAGTVVHWRDGQPVPVKVMQLCLSFDHAAIDGAQAATFLQHLVQRLQQPESVLGDAP